PGEALRCQKAPQMLEVMRVGDQRVGRIVPGSEVAEEGGDHGHGFPSTIEEFDVDAAIFLSGSSNGHDDVSLPASKRYRTWGRNAEAPGVRRVGAARRGLCGQVRGTRGRGAEQRGRPPATPPYGQCNLQVSI